MAARMAMPGIAECSSVCGGTRRRREHRREYRVTTTGDDSYGIFAQSRASAGR